MRQTNWRGLTYSCVFFLWMLAAGLWLTPSASGDIVKVVRVSGADDDHAVDLTVGDGLEVSLASTPGTGFSWRVARIDNHVLRQSREPELIHSSKRMPGGPATQVFHFYAAGAGFTGLTMDYERPWEHDTPPARTFHLTVRVRTR